MKLLGPFGMVSPRSFICGSIVSFDHCETGKMIVIELGGDSPSRSPVSRDQLLVAIDGEMREEELLGPAVWSM